MAITYPAGPPTFSADTATINRFLNSPTAVATRVNEIANQRFISDFILTSRQDVSGGAIVFDQDDPLYTDRPVEAISPGAEYPLAGVGSGTPQAVRVTKWGQDVPITDEKIKRSNFSPVEKAFNTIVNQIVKTIDSLSLSLVASQVTATQAAASTWSGVDPKILRDIMLAKAKVTGLNKGYDPDVIVVDDATWAILASDDKLSTLMAREDKGNAVYSGEFRTIAGLTILPTPNLPAAGAWIIDTNALGGIGDEKLGEGYAGDIVETKSIRDEDNDQWRVRGRRVCVPYVNEPGAAIKITGI
ncbi:hypothetical protein J6K27_003478 [Rhodococcus qingshengii]|nr:hypothetical protein J6K27_003478 [Rhodococcus qingshengii]